MAWCRVAVADALPAKIVILRFDEPGDDVRRTAERTGRRQGLGNLERLEVDPVLEVDHDSQRLSAGGKRERRCRDGGVGISSAGLGHRDRAGHVRAVDFDVERATGQRRTDAGRDCVDAWMINGDTVGEPFACPQPADRKSTLLRHLYIGIVGAIDEAEVLGAAAEVAVADAWPPTS